ncbi:MAG: AraC family transcriptional regulator [Bacteroides sp.]|nr:AraC family transcriptional regulator [Bacteroides sp.]
MMTKIPENTLRKLEAVMRRIEDAAAMDCTEGEDFSEMVAVGRLARDVGMSKRSLAEWFKKLTGSSVAKYANSRRAEYAARILRCFPATSNAEVSRVVGFSYPNALYDFMRRHGVATLDSLRGHSESEGGCERLQWRIERLPDCVLFFKLSEGDYMEFGTDQFERENWDEIERHVAEQFGDMARLVGYVGIAIDRFLSGDAESGVFAAGVLYHDFTTIAMLRDTAGSIGWRKVPTRRYAVFTHRGSYEKLPNFYERVLSLLNFSSGELNIDIARPFMERYLNSPTDTPSASLETELWVPLN